MLLLLEPTNKHAGLRTEFHVPSLVLELLATLTPPDWDVRIIQEPFDSVDFDEEVDLVGIAVATIRQTEHTRLRKNSEDAIKK